MGDITAYSSLESMVPKESMLLQAEPLASGCVQAPTWVQGAPWACGLGGRRENGGKVAEAGI